MTRRVELASPGAPRVNETQARALLLVRSLCGPSNEWASISYRRLAPRVTIRESTLRGVIYYLRGVRLLESRAVYLENGGQLESEYRLTPLGLCVTRELEDKGWQVLG